ncbi:MAG: hypothetical protein AUK16_02900 [Parcubacteria group bacterium CG2_30_44_11]|nr:MAG: hypothetical protein AUK16_02900 [Parcubacteria group bacterium CG2_30_44_11]
MYVISVIPLSRQPTLETLSYYSSTTYPLGTIIEVPLRKKIITAVVTAIEPVSAAKTALRTATFSLRKLAAQSKTACLPENVIKTAEVLMKTTPATLGSILYAILPPDIRSNDRPYPITKTYTNEEDPTPTILTDSRVNRFMAYRSLIRQAFAHRGSVLFVVPTSAAVRHAKTFLETGIEKRVVTFSSTHTKKQIDTSYEAFTDFSSAKLIITTPNFTMLDRHDITTIIIEESGSQHYKTRTRPYLDARNVLITYAATSKRTILFGDILPRTEEEVWRREDIYHTHEEHPHRLNFNSSVTIAKHQAITEKILPIFTTELIETINRNHQNKGRSFLLSARRGLAPLVLCFDCGHVFRCPDSGAPYTLFSTHKNGVEERWFYSTPTGARVRAADTCPDCGSWRLREQGIGIQQVVAHAHKLFPNIPLTIFDHTTATTHGKAKKLMEQFYAHKSGLMIATNMALPYLTEAVELTGIISYEAMRTMPTWRAEESVLASLLRLREVTLNECVVQTRSETDPLLKHFERGLIDDFYDEEIGMRQVLNYPPFAIFILLTWQGDKVAAKSIEKLVLTTLAHFDPQCYSTPLPSEKITRHALLRFSHKDWPPERLMDKLRSLPPMIRIEVSPERII